MKIHCVYPLSDHQTVEMQTFVMGSVSDWLPDSTQLYVENLKTATKQTVQIQRGFFSSAVALIPGAQTLRLTAIQADVKDTVDIKVCCLSHPVDHFETLDHALASWSPQGQVKVIPNYPVTFSGYVPLSWLKNASDKNSLTLNFQVENGETHTQDIIIHLNPDSEDGDRDTRQAVFAELHQVSPPLPRRGYCLTQIQFPEEAVGSCFKLSLVFQEKEYLLPVQIEVLSAPLFGMLKDGDNPDNKILARFGPTEEAARACPLLPETVVQVPFFHQPLVSNHLAQDRTYSAILPGYWVPTASITLIQSKCHALLEPIMLKLVTIETMAYQKHTPKKADRVRVTIPLSRQPLVSVVSKPGGMLEIKLAGVQHACDFIHFKDDGVLDSVLEAHLINSLLDQIVLNLTVPSLAGFDWAYESGALVIDLQFWPASIKDLRVLIDPGHGGEELGGISLTGMPEKILNTACADYLHHAFIALGLQNEQIQFTRSLDKDVTVSLSDRARIAKESSAHVLLSLHHNALPDGRDPQQYRGISTYYYHSFSRPLALRLYHALTQAANSNVSNNAFHSMPGFSAMPGLLAMPGFGVLWDSLAMTRITTAQAVLVELGFMTHPEDSILIHDTAHQKLLMSALAAAVVSGPAISERHQSCGFVA